ncbi:MAG: bifunctional adenosylcobinamide kinase/adenosylcobinamide-phosphate guanylyltransferase [Defluviitaleaceae bacterium]|nr:bifunctional adenosylcobinamide kinase/adenosylcobinamide-phosphate guanylyltransferase [Defluviitaleaceae bacterium]
MAKIIYVTGGAQSGKARWAVNYLGAMDNVMYMCAYDSLKKTIEGRIDFHCKKNGVNWVVQSDAKNLNQLVKGHKFAVLDNLGEYTNRAIKEKCDDLANITIELRKEIEKQVSDEITELIWEVKEIDGTLVILSVEIGLSHVPGDRAQENYRNILGNINQRIAHQAHEVYLVISGIPSKIK